MDPNNQTETKPDDELVVTAWNVKGKMTNAAYTKLIEKFGVEALTTELLDRFRKLTGLEKLHPLLERGMCFAHRHFNEILDDFEKGNQIFLYTGRGPTSDALHLGHIIPMEFTAWLQKVFGAIVVFQMADDEKYWFKDMEFDTIYKLGRINARDVIALGFNPDKTFIFSNRDFTQDPSYQKVAFDMMKDVNINTVKSIFGIEDSGCVGQLIWPIYQSTAAFSQAFKPIFNGKSVRCMVVYAIDQDPYFRMARDAAKKRGYLKPCSLMCQFLPALEGDSKMSSTGTNGPSKTIFMTDTVKEITDKIKRYALSGGRDTIEQHRKLGGDPDKDISFQWLRYFLEDDAKLVEIEQEYRSGRMITSDLKKITIDVIINVVDRHQKARSQVTDKLVDRFYDISKFSSQ